MDKSIEWFLSEGLALVAQDYEFEVPNELSGYDFYYSMAKSVRASKKHDSDFVAECFEDLAVDVSRGIEEEIIKGMRGLLWQVAVWRRGGFGSYMYAKANLSSRSEFKEQAELFFGLETSELIKGWEELDEVVKNLLASNQNISLEEAKELAKSVKNG